MVLACTKCGVKYNVADYKPDQQYACKKCKEALKPVQSKRMSRPQSGTRKKTAPKKKPELAESQIVSREDVLGKISTVSEESAIELDIPKGWHDKLCDTTIGGYKIIRKLGQGGMGMIYKAEQLSLNRIVAIKMLNHRLANDESFLKRFINEAKFVAKLNHPNLIQIFDVGDDEGKYYFSMEYVEGECVGDILDRLKVIPPQKSLDIIIQVTRALAQAHEHKIVHRDIKPDNIMLTQAGVAKLADLGIAKTDETAAEQNEQGMQMGTARYISPEQANDASKVDIRADVYSLGATFFHMVTGRTAISGKTLPVVLMKLATEPTPSATEFNGDVPWAMSGLIKKMMAKDVGERFQDPAELLVGLEELHDELKSGKKKSKKVQLGGRGKIMTIAAPVEFGDLALELSDSPEPAAVNVPDIPLAKEEAPRSPSDSAAGRKRPSASAVSPKDSRMTSGDRVFSAVQNRPNELAGVNKNKQFALAGVLALAAIVGLVTVLGGGGKSGDPDGGEAKKNTPVVKKKPQPKKPELTKAQKAQREAQAEWDLLSRIQVASLSDSQLGQLEIKLEAIESNFPGTRVIPAVKQRRLALLREQQQRQYQILEGKADLLKKSREWAKAIALLDGWAKKVGPAHSQLGKLKSKREGFERLSTAETRKLLSQVRGQARRGQYEAALARLEQTRPRQTAANQQQIKARQAAYQLKLQSQVFDLQARHYEPYVVKLLPLLSRQQYAEAFKLARANLTGALAKVVKPAEELADLQALATAWATLDKNLRQREGQEVELQFIGQAKPSKVKIIKVNYKRQQLTLKASLKRYTSLHASSLIKLCGASVDPSQPLGKLRLSLLLATIGRTEEAYARLDECKSDPAYLRFQLRLFSSMRSVLRARLSVKGQLKKSDRWKVESLRMLYRLNQVHAGSPFLDATRKERLHWANVVTRLVHVKWLLKRAKSLQRRSPTEARLLCRMLIMFYSRQREAREAAKLLEKIK